MIKNQREFILLFLQRVFDILAVYFSFMLAYSFRFQYEIFSLTKGIPPIEQYRRAMPVVIIVYLACLSWTKIYNTHRIIYKTDEFLGVVRAVLFSTLLITAATFLYREYSYSRLVLIYSAIFSVIFLYASHMIFRFLRSKFLYGGGKMGILLVGSSKVKERLKKNIARSGRFNVLHLSSFDTKKIKEIASRENLEEIVLTDTDVESTEIMKVINFCEDRGLDFKMVPDMIELKMGELDYETYFGIPALSLKHPLQEPSNYYFKRISDIVVSMLVLMIFSPFLIFLYIAIWLDSPGAPIYSHLRRGFKGRDFKFYKFRSMVVDADDRLESLMKYNERSGAAFKMREDPRITRVGSFIRKYSIDEIPQLFNVLKGDMSLVGPRPQVLWEAAAYDEVAKRRLNTLPGVTGLWQVSGRSDLTYEEMIELDIYYLENWSLGLDIKILIRTVSAVVLKKGAC
ncbi:MAG: sugar transferase [Elusimicrobia bacterium]|nr:sugar transferase [Elusimicrobiota bacterium]